MAQRAHAEPGPSGPLLAGTPVPSLDEYRRLGGLEALRIAASRGPDWVTEEIAASGLRGRGGAGFPTATKWRSVRESGGGRVFAVCNGAEGEPGTYKDRWLMQQNPYAVLEGLMIAGWVVGAELAIVGVKASFRRQIEALERAIAELLDADLLALPIELASGPDEYLFGEETGLLEVIEGADPLPRGDLRPFQQGLFGSTMEHNPTLVNNVETLANVPHILVNGARWYRSIGTERSPGTMLFTLSGDVEVPGVYELPLGTPLRALVGDIGGARSVKAVFTGTSAGMLRGDQLDVALDFESMREAGSGLGSGGIIAYGDNTCVVGATLAYARFLHVESCAQCPPCKAGAEAIVESLARLEGGHGTEEDAARILERSTNVTDGRRCALPVGTAALARAALAQFPDDVAAHILDGCPNPREIPIPKIVDYDPVEARFSYDERYRLKLPNWTYRDEQEPFVPVQALGKRAPARETRVAGPEEPGP